MTFYECVNCGAVIKAEMCPCGLLPKSMRCCDKPFYEEQQINH